MKFEYNTKITLARSNSKSVRTTIPHEVVKFLDLSEGDNLKWIVDVNSENIKTCVLKNVNND